MLLGYAGPSRSRRRERRELVGYLVFLAVCFAQVRSSFWLLSHCLDILKQATALSYS